MKFLALSSLFFGLSSAVSLVVSNNTVIDTDFNQGRRLLFSLDKRPNSTVYVALSFADPGQKFLRLDSAQLEFSPSNWNATQAVLAYPLPMKTSGNPTLQIIVSAVIKASNSIDVGGCANDTMQNVTLTRIVSPSAECRSIGDPHVYTFDNFQRTYNGKGVFYMLKSKETIIQSLQFNCAGAFCNEGLAIKHYGSVLSLTINPQLPQNAALKEILSTPMLVGKQLQYAINDAEKTVKISLDDGTELFLSIAFWPVNKMWYTNINLVVPGTYRQRVSGLCGNFDQNPDNDALPIEPEPVRAPVGANLFACGVNCTDLLSISPVIPTNVEPLPPRIDFCPPVLTRIVTIVPIGNFTITNSTTTVSATPTKSEFAVIQTPVKPKKCYTVKSSHRAIVQPKENETTAAYCERALSWFKCAGTPTVFIRQCAMDNKRNMKSTVESAKALLRSMELQCEQKVKGLLESLFECDHQMADSLIRTYKLKYRKCNEQKFKCKRKIGEFV